MTYNTQIIYFIIRSIKINMMYFKSSFSLYTARTLILKGLKSIFPILYNLSSFISAFIRAKSKFTTTPISMSKFFFTGFANRISFFCFFTFKITSIRAKYIFNVLGVNFKNFTTKLTDSCSFIVSKFIRACDRTEFTFRTICGKDLITC